VLVRRLARPMLASMFILGGVDTLRRPEEKIAAAEGLGLEENTEQLVKGNAAAQIVAGLAFGLGCVIAFLIARGIVGPLGRMTRAMGVLAAGDVKVEIPGRGNSDEIGDMAKAVQVFKDNMIEADRLRAEQETQKRQTEAQRRQSMLDMVTELLDRSVLDAGGLRSLGDVAQRRLQLSAHSFSRPVLLAALPLVAALATLAWWKRDRLALWVDDFPAMRAALIGAVVATVVGTLANDSGALLLEIGAVYLLVLVAWAWSEAGRSPPPA